MYARFDKHVSMLRDMDFVVGDFSALHHYVLVWMAIVTSPRGGLQLDVWLSAMAAMDVLPLAAAAAKVWSNGEGRTRLGKIGNAIVFAPKSTQSCDLSQVAYSRATGRSRCVTSYDRSLANKQPD